MKVTSNLTQNKQKTQKAQSDNKNDSFPKESVENEDLHKPLLNKIKTMRK